MMRSWLGVLMVGMVLVVLGCSGGPPMAEVEGVVTAGGQPLDKIQVDFYPAVDGPNSAAVTDSSGKFVLKTAAGRSGAVVGNAKIVLRDTSIWGDKIGRMNEGKDLSKGKKIRIPAQYSDLKTTPLTREIKGGTKNTVNIEVK